MSDPKPRRGYGRVAHRRDPNVIPPELEDEFRKLLGNPAADVWSTTWPALREIAMDYRRDKVLVDEWITVPQTKSALEELQGKFYDLARCIHDLDVRSMTCFADVLKTVRFPVDPYELEDRFFDIYGALTIPLKELHAQRGRPRRIAIPAAIDSLEKLYARATGGPLTWDCHGRQGERKPISAGSRFVATFFGVVDPGVTITSIEHYRRARASRRAA